MSRDLLSQLKEQRDQLADRKAQVDLESRNLEGKLREVDRAIGTLTSALEAAKRAVVHEAATRPTQTRARNQLTPAEIGAHARRLLVEHGRPLKRGPLLKLFDAAGIPIVGGDRAKVLGTIIWRARNAKNRPEFVNTDEGYWPSDLEIPTR